MTPTDIAHQTETDPACPPEPENEGGFEGPGPAELAAFMEAYRASYTNLTCPRCISSHGQWQGYRTTRKHGVVHRRKCTDCGRWYAKPMPWR